MAAISRDKVAGNITSTKFAMDIPSKLNNLRQLKDDFSHADSLSISELLPPLLELHSDRCSPVRKFIAEIAVDVGLKYADLIPDIIPVLITLLKDGTPAVARQAITCGTDLFRCTLVKVAIQGLYSSELDDSLESAWVWVLKLKDEIYSIAFQPENDGRRLLALKFVEVITLLYTPDPSGPSEPPADHVSEGKFDEFNVSWLRGGHPILNVGDLSVEASQNLGLLLDQLRFPTVKSLSNLVIIVLISSLSAIAKKRPAFYGRILPVLLSLDPLSSASRGLQISGVHHALRKAFLSCLKCTHPGAAPWRDRLAVALREMKVGGLTEEALQQDSPVNGNAEGKNDSSVAQEEKPSLEARDAVPVSSVRKRSGTQDVNDMIKDDDTPGKRARKTPNTMDGITQASSRDHDGSSSSGLTTSKENVDNGPVQQLVAMFGALVAQGEKAVGSLEILISSISADLLAEVVMANMRHLPPVRPKADAEEEPLQNMRIHPDIVGTDTHFKNLSSFLTDIFSCSSNIQKTDSLFDGASEDHEMQKPEEDECPAATLTESDVACSAPNSAMDHAILPVGLPVSSSEVVPSVMDVGLTIPSEVSDIGALENEIPGLESAVRSDGWQETQVASSLLSAELEDTSQEQVTSLGRSSLDVLPSMSTDRSEELSPKTTLTEATSINSSTDTSTWLSSQVVLPKMSAPVISLADGQKDLLQNLAFVRIIEAYKQIAVAGGSQLRFSLLAYLGVEFPLELDPWKLLQKHILSDYMNHQGHELTLRVLYRLFGEAEADHDFFSSANATSVYEMFLLTVAETLRDSFPATDKSLSKLLSEVPYLPKSVLKLLECLCSPGISDKEELPSGERVHQGLSTVWSLILLRPPIRDVCLKIVLQSAVHHLEEVRMKAIRLVANKLYPIPSISPQIEDFAKETLLSAMNVNHNTAKPGADGSNIELEKDPELENPSNECPLSFSGITKDTSSESGPSSASENASATSVIDAKRCMSLYFALCTKKHLLFRQVFVIYKNMSKAAKQAVHIEIPKLVRTIGSSSQLLEIISDPPAGSVNLLTQVLQTLTDGTIPSPELIITIKKLYDTKVKDADILIPVLPFLPKDEVMQVFPQFVKLQLDKFQLALARILTGSSQSGPVLTPAEVLIAIHGIDPDRDGIPLKKVTDACNTCFEQQKIFTQQVLAKVLNQLVEQIPLPLLFMRTVLQAIGAFPSLVEFIMEILSRLVSKQIWKYPKLWVGFLKCAQLTKPQSFSVLLQLPPAQLENALNRIAALKAPLIAHANQPNIRSSLPRSVLTVLGIALDSQSASQGQATQSQTGDTGNSDKEVATEKPKESSSAC